MRVCLSVGLCVSFVCLSVCLFVLGTLYSEFHYETPPPAYNSLHQLQLSTTTTATAAAAADDDDDDVNVMIHSNPPSYRSRASRRCRHAASNGWSPPDYITAMSNHTRPGDSTGTHTDA